MRDFIIRFALRKYKKSSAEEAENYKTVAVPACCLSGLFFVFIEICRIFLPLPMGEVPAGAERENTISVMLPSRRRTEKTNEIPAI